MSKPKNVWVLLGVLGMLISCGTTAEVAQPVPPKDDVVFDYEFTAPDDFTLAFHDDEDPNRCGLILNGEKFNIWVNYKDFESGDINLLSIEERGTGLVLVYLSETVAEARKMEPKGKIFGDTAIRFDEQGLAHGVVAAQLYPVDNSGWKEGEPQNVKIVFNNIGVYED